MIDLNLSPSSESLTPMERYLSMKEEAYAYHPFSIYLYETLAWAEIREERRRHEAEQLRIDRMDPADYLLELDCATLVEFDRILDGA